jgi:hypothetical protein
MLAYIPDHFISVVPALPDSTYIPLYDKDGMPIDVRFVDRSFSHANLREYLDIQTSPVGLVSEREEGGGMAWRGLGGRV